MARPVRCHALLVHPRFGETSFWNYRATCHAVGAQYPTPPLGLLTVAALLPATWDIRLVDLNTSELSAADWEWADLVMTGGMLPQQRHILRIIDEAHHRGKPVVVGGPDITSSPEIYEHADFRVLGEAEAIMAAFLTAWTDGETSGVFDGGKFKADVTTSPIPRFDLLRFDDYLYV